MAFFPTPCDVAWRPQSTKPCRQPCHTTRSHGIAHHTAHTAPHKITQHRKLQENRQCKEEVLDASATARQRQRRHTATTTMLPGRKQKTQASTRKQPVGRSTSYRPHAGKETQQQSHACHIGGGDNNHTTNDDNNCNGKYRQESASRKPAGALV